MDSCIWVGLASGELDHKDVIRAAGDVPVFAPRPRYNDLWLAAQAIEHGYQLMTMNQKDFTGMPGLKLVAIDSCR